jgi:hypothetical protein
MAIEIVPHKALDTARALERRAGFLADLIELLGKQDFDALRAVTAPETLAATAERILELAQQLHAEVRHG